MSDGVQRYDDIRTNAISGRSNIPSDDILLRFEVLLEEEVGVDAPCFSNCLCVVVALVSGISVSVTGSEGILTNLF